MALERGARHERRFMQLMAVVKQEGKWYSAMCPDVDIASQGKTFNEARTNLQESLELYFEDKDAEHPERSCR